MKTTKSDFNPVAELYDSTLPPIPEEYYDLLKRRFSLNKNKKVLDLGCGSGLLTFELCKLSEKVEGLDVSEKMIEIARVRDRAETINWIHGSVETFDFGKSRYSLIISFESFHLFANQELIRKCGYGLRPNGFLCIGWCNYQWEQPLKETIIEVFKSIGIEWGIWGYQSCSNFSQLIRENKLLSPVVEEHVEVKTKSHVNTIANYLASIDKATQLDSKTRAHLIDELKLRFTKVFGSEWITGNSSYFIGYCKKLLT